LVAFALEPAEQGGGVEHGLGLGERGAEVGVGGGSSVGQSGPDVRYGFGSVGREGERFEMAAIERWKYEWKEGIVWR